MPAQSQFQSKLRSAFADGSSALVSSSTSISPQPRGAVVSDAVASQPIPTTNASSAMDHVATMNTILDEIESNRVDSQPAQEQVAPQSSQEHTQALSGDTVADQVVERPQAQVPAQPSTFQEAIAQPSTAPTQPAAVAGPVTLPDQAHSGLASQALPSAADQAYYQHQAQQSGQSFKEVVAAPAQTAVESTTAAAAPVEAGANIQYVEQEKTPELPPEVEGYLQHVEDNADQAPEEIVIADATSTPLAPKYPKQSVVVLPITPEVEEEGAKKNTSFSIRWLVEWSRKLMKVFSGTIIYREDS